MVVLAPAAKLDCRNQVRYCRKESGRRVSAKLIDELQKAFEALLANPAFGSPVIGQQLGVAGLRAWRLNRFPLSVWYFDRGDEVLVVRLVGHRADDEGIDLELRSKTRRLVDLVGVLNNGGGPSAGVSVEDMRLPE